MIEIVFPETRFEHASALIEMHHDRKRVFVDKLGWSLPTGAGWLEVDEFDNEYAVYLLARSRETGRHVGSVRLLPTTRPHMLGTMFSNLCAGKVPRSEDCWEISRFLTCPPEVEGTSVLKIHRLLAIALIEIALLKSIRCYTLVTEPQRLPALLSIGWSVVPLGIPTRYGRETLQALQILVDPEILPVLRRKTGVSSSVLQFSEQVQVAA